MENKKLTPFKMCVLQNFPFIEANFDALTNYGLMSKIVEYLNKVIEQQNISSENVNILLNWFNNLDVTDEINNKLDKMAEDGTLTNLLKDYYEPIINEQNNKINEINDKVNNVASGSPAGVYATISALQQADPDHSKIYVVEDDGEWYFWNTLTNQWKNGGVYQASVDSETVMNLENKVEEIENKLIYETGGFNQDNIFKNPSLKNGDNWLIDNSIPSNIVNVRGSHSYGVDINNVSGSSLSFRQILPINDFVDGNYNISFKRLFKTSPHITTIRVQVGLIGSTGSFGGLGEIFRSPNIVVENCEATFTIDRNDIATRFPNATHFAFVILVPNNHHDIIYEPLLIKSTETNKKYYTKGNVSINNSVLYGKSIYYDGDSIAYGSGNNGKGFGDILAEKYNMVIDKFAESGATLSVFQPTTRHNIVTSVKNNMTKLYDYMLIDGGYNDFGNRIPVGNLSNDVNIPFTVNPDESTILGSLESIFQYVQNNYPTTQIYFLLTHKTNNYWTKPLSNYGLTQTDVYDKIKECCVRYSVKIIDVFNNSGFCTYVESNKIYTNNSDLIHPTEDGYKIFYMPVIEKEMLI